MVKMVGGVFSFNDKVQIESLNHRLKRSHVINSNIANAETPGFRALGYDFESQLQEVAKANESSTLKVTHPKHMLHEFAGVDGTINPDVFVRPTESVGESGNTVDIDVEMGQLAENLVLYRATVEALNRKIGVLRYAISGGR
jgi:flagellar basal-body rod protein FlgB